MIAPWRPEPAEQEDLAVRIYRMLCAKSLVSLNELLDAADDAESLKHALASLLGERKITELRPLGARHEVEFVYYRRSRTEDAAWLRQHKEYQRVLVGPRERRHIDQV